MTQPNAPTGSAHIKTSLYAHVNPPGTSIAPPIVFLHGFTQDGGVWAPIRAALQADFPANFPVNLPNAPRTVAVDLPGHGHSLASGNVEVMEPFSMEDCLDALEDVLNGLEIKKAWWVGYSMGGRVALQMAAHRPHRVKGLALLSATAGLDDPAARKERRDADEQLARRMEMEGMEAFMEHWLNLPLFAGLKRLPSQTQTAILNLRLQNSVPGLAASLRGMGTGAMAPVWDKLPEITQPVLLMAGAEDEKYVALARKMEQALSNSKLSVVAGAGHALPLEAPDEVARALADFIRLGEGAEPVQSTDGN